MRTTLSLALWLSACADGVEIAPRDLAADTASVDPPPRVCRAVVQMPLGPFCVGSAQDIFKPTAGQMTLATSDPTLTVTWQKCPPGGAVQSSKPCVVRVGGYESFNTPRVGSNFTWPGGATSATMTFKAWPSPGDFANDPAGTVKELYLSCDDPPSGNSAWWRQEGRIAIKKVCP
ncbi:MAG TPA: hypothetical protein PKA64_06915 [Myxococcota bacterium]|nr:hypothetical protein [Myxococcota bacterium]